MGDNVWRSAEAWPPPDAQIQTYFLHSDGRAATLHGNGRLCLNAPRPGAPPDRYLYNPLNAVLTLGGAHLSGVAGVFEFGVQEQRPVEVREDVLVYTSEPLDRDTEVTGDVSLTLWAVPSAVDTDWTAMLADVHPDGSVYNVCDDILLLPQVARTVVTGQPGEAYQYRIDLGPTSMLFRKGHCIRLTVSSSNFPA